MKHGKWMIGSMMLWLAVNGGSSAQAQATIELQTDHSRVLEFEPVWVEVTVRNQLPGSLLIRAGHEGPRLDFRVRAQRSSRPVPRREQTPPPVFLGAHESATLRLDVSEYYDLTETGPYVIEAQLEIEGRVFLSEKKYVDVLRGSEVTRRLYHDPAAGLRLAKLFSLHRSGREHLLLRLDDRDETRCLAVLDLGTIIRLLPPTLRSDDLGRIHVLHQAGPFQYLHSLVTPPDAALEQTLYFARGATPVLEEDVLDGWAVTGAQRVTADFVPE